LISCCTKSADTTCKVLTGFNPLHYSTKIREVRFPDFFLFYMPNPHTALLKILADGQFHSGTYLGERLGISRAAVWKQVDRLAALGLDIHSVRGKGYRLNQALELLDAGVLTRGLSDCHQAIQDVVILTTTDSTNAEAMRYLHDGVDRLGRDKYLVFLSEQQTSGKGRRGRQWVSPFGQNMYLTLLRQVDTSHIQIEGVSLVIGLAVNRALVELGIRGTGVKWPNDILFESRKLAGILLEVTGDITGICQLVIGIGINIRCRTEDMQSVNQPWTDLETVAGGPVSRNGLVACVIRHVVQILDEFEKLGLEGFLDEWQKQDVLTGRQIEVLAAGTSCEGVARGISDSGALLLETPEGIVAFNGGEVSIGRRGAQ